MRIAISADDNRGLESAVSWHFGRCPYFVLVDLEENQTKAVITVPNPFYGSHQPGQVPAFIHQQGAQVMLTGGMGRRALAFFRQYNIEPVCGAEGTVQNALEQYLSGGLRGAAPCRESIAHGHDQTPEAAAPEEVARLREEAQMLRQQLAELKEQFRRLQGGK